MLTPQDLEKHREQIKILGAELDRLKNAVSQKRHELENLCRLRVEEMTEESRELDNKIKALRHALDEANKKYEERRKEIATNNECLKEHYASLTKKLQDEFDSNNAELAEMKVAVRAIEGKLNDDIRAFEQKKQDVDNHIAREYEVIEDKKSALKQAEESLKNEIDLHRKEMNEEYAKMVEAKKYLEIDIAYVERQKNDIDELHKNISAKHDQYIHVLSQIDAVKKRDEELDLKSKELSDKEESLNQRSTALKVQEISDSRRTRALDDRETLLNIREENVKNAEKVIGDQ